MTNVFCFTFGRYQPLTHGHIEHFNAMRTFALEGNYTYRAYSSETCDHDKNPLDFDTKAAYFTAATGERLIAGTNMFTVINDLRRTGIKWDEIVYFVGSDYVDNPVEATMFDRLKRFAENELKIPLWIELSGQRIDGLSGTALRQAAQRHDLQTFINGSPVGVGKVLESDVRRIFDMIRQKQYQNDQKKNGKTEAEDSSYCPTSNGCVVGTEQNAIWQVQRKNN